MKWIDALKIWNRGNDKWCIPRKNSSEYMEVQSIMAGIAAPSHAQMTEEAEIYAGLGGTSGSGETQRPISREEKRQLILDSLKADLAKAEEMMAGLSGKRKERAAVKIQALIKGVQTRKNILEPLLYKKLLKETLEKSKERRKAAYTRPKSITPTPPPPPPATPPPPKARITNPLNPLTPSPPPMLRPTGTPLFSRRVVVPKTSNLKPAKLTINELGEIIRPQAQSLTYEVRRNIEERLMSNEPLFTRPMTALTPNSPRLKAPSGLAPLRNVSASKRSESQFVRNLQPEQRPITAPASLSAIRNLRRTAPPQ